MISAKYVTIREYMCPKCKAVFFVYPEEILKRLPFITPVCPRCEGYKTKEEWNEC